MSIRVNLWFLLFMSNKIQDLLTKAELQKNSATREQSSVTNAERTFSNHAEAETIFDQLKEKLFHINRWNTASGISGYKLFDENGNDRGDERAIVGDFIRISLTGSGKYDWVRIIDIYQAPNEVVLTVQPSFNPTEPAPDEKEISHFFTDDATNNFCLQRNGKDLKLYVIGLSEKTNTTETNNLLETARNFATANLGSYLGIQIGEWKKFCESFLETKK